MARKKSSSPKPKGRPAKRDSAAKSEEPVHVIEDVEVLPAEEPPIEAEVVQSEIVPADADLPESSDLEPIEIEENEEQLPIRSSRDVVPLDPLSAYLREASLNRPLSREEERELAVRFFSTQDREAGYKLVVSNLWLVVKIAREYEKAARNLLDLIQEGNIGLIEAVKNFDPYRGVRFPSYAVWWVKAYIIRYVIANWRMVKIGTTQAQRKLFFNLKKEKEKLEREGFAPVPKLLAEKLNVREDEVVEMEQRLGASELSVDAPLQDDADQTMHSLLPSTAATAEESLAKKEMQELILKSFDEFSATLTEKERLIFRERMLGEEKATLQEISEKLDISRERVRQIENRLRDRLKEFLSERIDPETGGEVEF